MITIKFLGPIARDDERRDISNLKELKDFLLTLDGMDIWLSKCAISLNDEIITDINTNFKDGDVIVLLPPVCGG